ncbi:MAG: ABC transporter permease [Rhodothermales bacterium]
MNGPPQPLPEWAVWLLERLCPRGRRDILVGDFAEAFAYICDEEGRRSALSWTVWQLVKSTPAFLLERSYFSATMLGNYTKIAARNLKKRAFFSALNIGGLAIGMAICLLIFQYVAFESSYDTFHEKSEHLYRVVSDGNVEGGIASRSVHTWYALRGLMDENLPAVEQTTRYHPNWGSNTVIYDAPSGDRILYREPGIGYADSTFFSMFDVQILRGEADRALATPGEVYLSETTAQKYFGEADPIGKVLSLHALIKGDFTVAGVFADVPSRSHFSFDLLLPMHDLLQTRQYTNSDGWGWTNFVTYTQLREGADPVAAAATLDGLLRQTAPDVFVESPELTAVLQPVTDIHLQSNGVDDTAGSHYKLIYFFGMVGVFVLLIAWINYINLSTARAMERAKEVGVRKAIGATKGNVIAQFILEALLTNGLALILAIALAVLALPLLNQLADVQITLDIWTEPLLWTGLGVLFVGGAVLTSLYPAFILSGFQPAQVLKGQTQRGTLRDTLRKGLVVLQFAASILLLIGTFAVYSQVDYMRSADLGLDMDQVLVVERPQIRPDNEAYRSARNTFKQEAERLADVVSFASSTTVPGGSFSFNTSVYRQGDDPSQNQPLQLSWVSDSFAETYDIDVVAGRLFSADREVDRQGTLLVNEALVRAFGFESNEAALGHKLVFGDGEDDHIEIVGVLEDFSWAHVREEQGPVAFLMTPGGSFFSMKVNTADMQATLAAIEAVYTEQFPGNPFSYFFADEAFDKQYRADQRFGVLFGTFALFALVVACLGLIGLAAYMVAQRTKEIGVRKVLGASSTGIVRLLLSDFAKLVGLAFVVAMPLAYVALDAWLDNFATRIDLSIPLFIMPGLAVMMLALLTVSYHTLRTARSRPITALRMD